MKEDSCLSLGDSVIPFKVCLTSLTGFTSMLYHLQVSLNLQNHMKTKIKPIKLNKANIKYKNTRS